MKWFFVSTFDELYEALVYKGSRKIQFTTIANCPAGLVLESPDRRDVTVGEGDLVIDARNSPVPIQFYGFELNLYRTANVVIRNVHIRRGAAGYRAPRNKSERNTSVGEALAIVKCENVLLENCTFAWGTDESVSIIDSRNVVLYRCLMGAPLDAPRDEDGEWLHYERQPHGYGLLVNGSERVYVDKCLFVHCRRRTPSISGEGKFGAWVSVHNNLMYNYGEQAVHFNVGGGKWKEKTARLSIERNTFVPGCDTEGRPLIFERPPQRGRKVKLYAKRNYYDSGKKAKPKIKKESPNKGKLKKKSKYRIEPYDCRVYSSAEILDKVGAFPRDRVDERMLLDADNGTGRFLDHEEDLPEYSDFEN